MKKKILFLLFGLVGCTTDVTSQQLETAVSQRAAYDFDCKQEDIKVSKLQESSRYVIGDAFNEGTFGASGCEKKATYTVRNEGGTGKILVYKEGAAPNPVVNNTTIVQPYEAPDMSWHPTKSHF